MYTAVPSATNTRAMKYLGEGSVMMGTRHRNSDTKIMKTGKSNGTCQAQWELYICVLATYILLLSTLCLCVLCDSRSKQRFVTVQTSTI
jgi:hypothetical protein